MSETLQRLVDSEPKLGASNGTNHEIRSLALTDATSPLEDRLPIAFECLDEVVNGRVGDRQPLLILSKRLLQIRLRRTAGHCYTIPVVSADEPISNWQLHMTSQLVILSRQSSQAGSRGPLGTLVAGGFGRVLPRCLVTPGREDCIRVA